MFQTWGGCLAYSSTNLSNLLIIFPNFLHNTSNIVRTTHFSIVGFLQCMCMHPINFTSIHFLCCTHANECTWTHDVVYNTFATIVQDVDFHGGWEQLHAFFSVTFNSSHLWVDIEFTKYGIHALVDNVIIDSTHANLLFRSCTTQGFATFNVAQTKKMNYYDWHPTDQFMLLAIEIFGCLHK
jgi:hypothetical protein